MNALSAGAPRALVVGAGISGLATANRLARSGWIPVIVEKAPHRRSGGYFVGVFASGRRTADQLGILSHMTNLCPDPSINYEIDRQGHRRLGISFRDVPGGPWMTLRGEVEKAAFAALDPDVVIQYSTRPTRIEQHGDRVRVELQRGDDGSLSEDEFDLVVGADGLRSSVREMVFGPHEKLLRRLDAMIVAYELRGTLPGTPMGVGLTLAEPERTFSVFPFQNRPSTVLWSYRTGDVAAEFSTSPAQRLQSIFGRTPLGAVLDAALAELEAADEYVFDSVEQPQLDTWHQGRVVLVGDSAWCPTLYSGMGISISLAGADLLGKELLRHSGSVEQALTEWERKLRPYADYYQLVGRRNQFVWAPADLKDLRKRKMLIKLRVSPVTGTLLRRYYMHSNDLRMRNADISAD